MDYVAGDVVVHSLRSLSYVPYALKSTSVEFWPQAWLDISSMAIAQPTEFVFYEPQPKPSTLMIVENSETGVWIVVSQDNSKTYRKVVLLSLDKVLAEMGGTVSIIFLLVGGLVSSYQNFSFKSSMIEELFRLDENSGKLSPDTDLKSLAAEMMTRKKAEFNYFEFLFTRYIGRCFFWMKCYKNRKKRIDAYEEAVIRLNKEIDFEHFVKSTRVFRMLSDLKLQSYQARLVRFLDKYTIDIDNPKLPKEEEQTDSEIWAHFQPSKPENEIDKYISNVLAQGIKDKVSRKKAADDASRQQPDDGGTKRSDDARGQIKKSAAV